MSAKPFRGVSGRVYTDSSQPGWLENERKVQDHRHEAKLPGDDEVDDPAPLIINTAAQFASTTGKRRFGVYERPEDICSPARWDEPNNPILDIFGNGVERGFRAHLTYDPDRHNAVSYEAYISWHVYHEIGRDFFDAAVFVPKNAALDYLRAVGLNHEPVDQRKAWVDMGHDGLDFDTITTLVNDQISTSAGPTPASDSDPEDDDEEPDNADRHCFEDEVDARLFLDEALEGLEWWVWWLDHYGIPQTEWADHIPADFIDGISHLPSFFSRALKRARATVESWSYGS